MLPCYDRFVIFLAHDAEAAALLLLLLLLLLTAAAREVAGV
jgi:hypothetical protein